MNVECGWDRLDGGACSAVYLEAPGIRIIFEYSPFIVKIPLEIDPDVSGFEVQCWMFDVRF